MKTNKSIVLGLSGGPDSVYLLHTLKVLHDEGTISLIAAHLNHQWRYEADAEQDFCAALCATLQVPFVTQTAEQLSIAIKPNGSQEDIGRKMRRSFLESVATKHNADFIALAHHKDDQLETFFIRLARGSSLDGLGGMKDVDGLYLRPLLSITKQEILDFLTKNTIPFVHDRSNESDTFLRNRIRRMLIPALTACDERFGDKIISTMEHLQADNQFLNDLTSDIFQATFTTIDTTLTGSLAVFQGIHAQIQKRLIIAWLVHENIPFSPSAGLIDEIIRFLSHDAGGRHAISTAYSIMKKQKLFWIEKNAH